MKKLFLLSILSVFFFSCSDDSSTKNPTEEETYSLPEVSNVGFDFSASDIESWELVWEDNFDGDLSDWNIWNGGAYNEELQLYKQENLYVEEGYLFIEQLRQTENGFTNPNNSILKSFNFSSGRIETKDLYNPSLQGTLRIAARIKLPVGEGLWPAFWSYGDPWPTQGEIDIMEFRGGRPNEHIMNYFYGVEANTILTNPSVTTFTHDAGVDLTAEFHVFDLVWSQNKLVVSLDGIEIRTFNSSEFEYVDDLYNKNEKVVLNLAVGGTFFNGMNLNTTDIPDKSYMIVDWVKIFKQ